MDTILSLALVSLSAGAALSALLLTGRWRSEPYLTGYVGVTFVVAFGCLFGRWDAVTCGLLDSWQALVAVLLALECGRSTFESMGPGWCAARRKLKMPTPWDATARRCLLIAVGSFALGCLLMAQPTPPMGHWGFRGFIALNLATAAIIAEVRHGLHRYGLTPPQITGEILTGLAVVWTLQAGAYAFAELWPPMDYALSWAACVWGSLVRFAVAGLTLRSR